MTTEDFIKDYKKRIQDANVRIYRFGNNSRVVVFKIGHKIGSFVKMSEKDRLDMLNKALKYCGREK